VVVIVWFVLHFVNSLAGAKGRIRISLPQLLCTACFRFLSNKSVIAAAFTFK